MNLNAATNCMSSKIIFSSPYWLTEQNLRHAPSSHDKDNVPLFYPSVYFHDHLKVVCYKSLHFSIVPDNSLPLNVLAVIPTDRDVIFYANLNLKILCTPPRSTDNFLSITSINRSRKTNAFEWLFCEPAAEWIRFQHDMSIPTRPLFIGRGLITKRSSRR